MSNENSKSEPDATSICLSVLMTSNVSALTAPKRATNTTVVIIVIIAVAAPVENDDKKRRGE